MKAAYIEKFGGPEVLIVGDLPDPVAGPGQRRLQPPRLAGEDQRRKLRDLPLHRGQGHAVLRGHGVTSLLNKSPPGNVGRTAHCSVGL